MKHKPRRLTRTATYMLATGSKSGLDGCIERPVARSPVTGALMPEASTWHGDGGGETDPDKVAEQIARSGGSILFFLDNSFFDEKTPSQIWDALFGLRNSVVITPEVSRELAPWLACHPNHPAAKAIVGKAGAIRFLGTDSDCPVTTAVFEYYVNLLGKRKQLFAMLDKGFEEEHGRPPDEPEKKEIRRKALEGGPGPRGHLFGKKGEADAGKANFLTDEVLVTTAVVAGIERAQSTLILTKDEDLIDQHYKLLWLMDTQYRGMLLADRFADEPKLFSARPFEPSDSSLAMAFEPAECTLVERTPEMGTELLPPGSVIPMHCCVVGRMYHGHTFGAHSGLRNLLVTKGKTRGLNTDRFGGMNCHYWLSPLPVPAELRNCAVIARDRTSPAGITRLPILDVNQVLMSVERYVRITSPTGE